MLDALRFVQGAIQRNGISPELEHFRIKDGRIVGFNGYMALSSPIALDIEAMPKATTFHKALQACGETISLAQTASGRLHIRSGAFSVFVPCIEHEVFDAAPEGEMYPVPAGMAKAFARILPFVGDDASRPWAMGVSVGRGCYTATNNIILIQIWDGHVLPEFNCPRFAVAEVARIKEDPVGIQLSDQSITFHYSDGRWLRTQRLATEWPTDKMNEILNQESNPKPIPETFAAAVDTLTPFAEEGASSPIYFVAGGMSTGPAESEEGAFVEVPGLVSGPAFRMKALQLLKHEITTIDLERHPLPCLFFGDNLRGALLGMSL